MPVVTRSASRQKIRLLIAEDSPLFRKSIVALLKGETMIGSIMEAESASAAVRILNEHHIDVVLLDVRLKDSDGFEIASYVRANKIRTRLLAITSYTDQINLLHLAKSGVHGILLKHTVLPEELVDAIQVVDSGRRYFAPKAATVINDYVSELDYLPSLQLSDREKQLLPLLARGFTAKEIGTKLKLETGTVESYRKKLMSKTLTHTVQELISFAYRNGLLTPQSEMP